jgi:two-component system, chemotaxis family, response regulator Rcp1
MRTASRPFDVLLVEDNPTDVRLTVEALREASSCYRLHVAADGEQAMAYLKERGRAGQPDLVLLDLNLPRKDGREVLQEMKADASLRHIPVVVLTTSSSDQDIAHCYRQRANAYITKPSDLDDFFEVVKVIDRFWSAAATLVRGA